MLKLNFIFTLFFLFLMSGFAIDKPISLAMGKLIKDCDCFRSCCGDGAQGETKTTLKKGEILSGSCKKFDDHMMYCYLGGNHDVVRCPEFCINIIEKAPLTKTERIKAINDYLETAKKGYAKVVPSVVMSSLIKKFPGWYPILNNSAGQPDFFAQYTLSSHFYLELPVAIQPNYKTVSIVYFHNNVDDLLNHKSIWSFWDTASGDLIYSGPTPYPTNESVYTNRPCLVPLGDDLKNIVLAGITAGPSDAASCCGPYELSNLKDKGPVLIAGNKELETRLGLVSEKNFGINITENMMRVHSLCREGVAVIDGPANLRYEASDKSKITGQCQDKSLAVIFSKNSGWFNVECNGKGGWTSEQNIRKR